MEAKVGNSIWNPHAYQPLGRVIIESNVQITLYSYKLDITSWHLRRNVVGTAVVQDMKWMRIKFPYPSNCFDCYK
ncbi:hypothetical protein VNO77_24779 [Canavalia gladiata]|uniref:Uncharacterized protein n=1 Tax=Canavalia gladiata TaxID=3824 RepID=A0AAN9LA98_CANGL